MKLDENLLKIDISFTKREMGLKAAEMTAEILKSSLAMQEKVSFVAATGASQFEFLESLCKIDNIDWQRTEMFHLDEYIGLAASHPASFRKYLSERLVKRVAPGQVHFIQGDYPNPTIECRRINDLIKQTDITVAFIGIGENGHIAFNDPPADFEIEDPYIIVDLDEQCRKQQVGEGWFSSLEDVPRQAISMSIKQIMKAKMIICTCPEKRKAEAVRDCLSENSPITPIHPASILKTHPNIFIYLDQESSVLLR